MVTVLKVLLVALLEALAKQLPTVVAAWQRYQARQAAAAQLAEDRRRIEEALRPPPPK